MFKRLTHTFSLIGTPTPQLCDHLARILCNLREKTTLKPSHRSSLIKTCFRGLLHLGRIEVKLSPNCSTFLTSPPHPLLGGVDSCLLRGVPIVPMEAYSSFPRGTEVRGPSPQDFKMLFYAFGLLQMNSAG